MILSFTDADNALRALGLEAMPDDGDVMARRDWYCRLAAELQQRLVFTEPKPPPDPAPTREPDRVVGRLEALGVRFMADGQVAGLKNRTELSRAGADRLMQEFGLEPMPTDNDPPFVRLKWYRHLAAEMRRRLHSSEPETAGADAVMRSVGLEPLPGERDGLTLQNWYCALVGQLEQKLMPLGLEPLARLAEPQPATPTPEPPDYWPLATKGCRLCELSARPKTVEGRLFVVSGPIAVCREHLPAAETMTQLERFYRLPKASWWS